MRIKKGDQVQVNKGKDRKKRGKAIQVIPDQDKVVVEGVNIAKKHQKPRSAQQPGEILDKNMPIPAANLQLVCPQCNLATRVGMRLGTDGTKQRVCKKCSQPIDN